MEGQTISKEASIASSQFVKERDYWLKKLSGELSRSSFPYDYTGTKTAVSFPLEKDSVACCFSGEIFSGLMKLSRGNDYVLHMIAVAATAVLLGKYTYNDNKDIILGTPIYKQEIGVDMEFVNTALALRVQPEEGMTFKELLYKVRETMLEADENKNYPIEVLASQLHMPMSDTDFPLFDVAVLLENIHDIVYLNPVGINMIFCFRRTGESVEMEVQYNVSRYEQATVEGTAARFTLLLQQVLSNVDLRLSDIDIITEEERKRLLKDFNDAVMEYPGDKIIHQLFEEQVERTPDRLAVVDSAAHQLTYKGLNEKSDQLAHLLIEKGVLADSVVGIMVKRSVEMIIGIMGILKAGGAYLPIAPDYPQERIDYMLENSCARVLLSDALEITHPGLRPPLSRGDSLNRVSSANLAYVLYTSGSTGRPKGVMMEHRNVVNLVWGLWERIYKRYSGARKVALVAPYVFDASVQQIFAALLLGHTLCIVPEETRIDGAGLIEFYREHGIDISDGTPTHMRLMVDAAGTGSREAPFRGLKIKHFIIGGEAMPRKIVEAFLKGFPGDGRGVIISNVYGPTECCVDSTSFDVSVETLSLCQRDIIPIGKPMPNEQIYILNSANQLQPMGVPGELCIGGDGVGRGYLKQPELTAEKFNRTVISHLSLVNSSSVKISKTTNDQCPMTNDRLYRTGDLARWLPDGNIEFLGRLDYQVKIRGFRIELGEIESLLLNHEAVKEAVVVDIDMDKRADAGEGAGDKSLCAYIVVDRAFEERANAVEFREYLSRMLPDYMVPPYFVFLEKLPLTASGKVNRKVLPVPEIGPEEGEYTAPRTVLEEKLVKIWSGVLKIDPSKIGIDTGFFNIGGQSLKATVMISEIHRQLNVKVPLVEVFKAPTIREISCFIAGAEVSTYTSIEKVPEQEYYPLSFAQRRLWVLCQFEEDSTAYNMPGVFVFSGQFNAAAFERAVQTAAGRHESLRTVFVVIDGEPKQKITRDFHFQLEHVDLRRESKGAASEIDEETRRIFTDFADSPFDLENGPLFRFKLIRFDGEKYLLMFNIHHIITDGWSTGNLFNECIILYNAFSKGRENPLPPLRLQYKDYAAWHNTLIEKGSFDRSGDYWLEKFKDKPNGIELPLDHPRGVIQTFNGGRVPFVIGKEETAALYRIGRQEDATLFMVLLALVNLFLYRYTGQEDILVGSPVAGRKNPELHPLVGFLVNTLVYRNTVKPAQTFRELLANIKKEALACYEYQDYPFDLLVERLELDRDLSRSPLFNVMLAHNNADTEDRGLVLEGIRVEHYPYADDFNMSKFDLIFFMDEFSDSIVVRIEYNSDLFERRSIERMAANFLAVTADIAGDENSLERPVHAVNCLDKAEYETVVHGFNDNRAEFSPLTLQEMFESQVEKNGDAAAVVGPDGRTVTYDWLNRRANKLAHYLREEYGIRRGDIVGICSERCIEMIVILLGIVKAGAGYVSIDPGYPEDRILHMLKDSRAQWVVTKLDRARPELFADYVSRHGGIIIDYPRQRETMAGKPGQNPPVMNTLSDALYVIYTSGSTGTPNGAMLSQGILSNLAQWQQQKTSIDASLRCLQFTSINFCVSFQEIFITLTAGGQVHLIGEIERQDIDYLVDFLVGRRIELLYLPFSYLNFLFNESNRWEEGYKTYLKHIITAGEQLKVTSGLKHFLEAHPGVRLHNHYGSSEMHVVTSYTLDAAAVSLPPVPPAGKPITNTSIYILDESNNAVPIGVWGELCIAGSWEVLGYIHNAGLTDEKLFTHPVFSAENDNKRLYRSGDIGRWLEDGNIELKGRKDFQVKIRGFRVEPAEIESKILAIPEVTDCVVVVREESGAAEGKTTVRFYLAAYVVVDGIDAGGIRRIIGNKLPQYMIPKIVILERLPLMPNGKVDRDCLPDPGLMIDETGGFAAPEDDIQGKLAQIWSGLLGIDADRIGIDDNFFERGGHSLKATSMMAKIHKTLNVKVELLEIFKTPTIRDLARHIKGLKKEMYTAVESVEERSYYPLSSAQKRLYILWKLDPEGTAYNMTAVVELTGRLDKNKLERAFRQLIERHESFRTSFTMVQKNPVQRIWPAHEIEFSLEYLDLSGLDKEESVRRSNSIIRESIRPFDLSRAPLLRVALIHTPSASRPPLSRGDDTPPFGHPPQEGIPADKHILMVDMHHIISDGTSLGIFIQDFTAFYSGRQLSALRLQYKDFAGWQTGVRYRGEANSSLEQQEKYWLKRFAGGIPKLALPTDFPRPPYQSFEGDFTGFTIDTHRTSELRKLVKETGTTIYMVLLAVYNILLSKYTLQDDIVVGTGVAGRRHADLENIIGMFINMLPMRNFPGEEKRFDEFLQEVKRNAVDAFENQEYQFEELVEKLAIPRDSGRNPLFDVEFTVQNTRATETAIDIPGIRIMPYGGVKIRKAKFDLGFDVVEGQENIHITVSYAVKLFEQPTVEKMLRHYREILHQVLENREIKLEDIRLSHKLSAVTEVIDKEETLFGF